MATTVSFPEEETIRLRDAIGIDPDSKGFVCATVKLSGAPVTTKGYLTTESDLKAFVRWLNVRGHRGQ